MCEECGRRLGPGEHDICTHCEERLERWEREHSDYEDEGD